MLSLRRSYNLPSIREKGPGNIRTNMPFRYRNPITIKNKTWDDLSNYQVLVELSSSNFDFDLVQSDGADIRFTDSDGNLLGYWIESWDKASESASVWVKVSSIPASPDKTEIFMYYGNPSVSSASDGDATFEFFDDFDDNVYDTSKWATPVQGPGNYAEEDGVLKLTVTGTDAPYRALTKSYTMSDGIIEMKVKWVSSTATPHMMIFVRQPSGGDVGELTARGGTNNDFYFHDGTQKGAVSFTPNQNEWHFMRFKLQGSNAWGYIKNLETGAEASTSITDFSTLTSPGRLGPGVWNNETTNHFDDFRVRKYASPEPTVSIGTMEEV